LFKGENRLMDHMALPPHEDMQPPITPEIPAPPQRLSLGTYIVLIFLLIVFPAFNIIGAFYPIDDFDFTDNQLIIFFFVPTIVILWLIVILCGLAMWREKSTPASIGLGRIRGKHLLIAIVFLFASNIILYPLQFLLSLFGLVSDEILDKLVMQASRMMWWWLAMSFTAGFCEEIVFRGYLMTRIKAVMRVKSWYAPALIATLAFASGHLYQGYGGVILIFIYGLMFCWLYIKTKSLWPCILVHFIQDFSAILIIQLKDF